MKKSIHLSILLLFISLISTSFIQAQPCEIPDNGTGTITLPPMGCQYISPDEVFEIIDGLPAGTTIELEPLFYNFVCCDPPCQQCTLPIAPGACETVGGDLGGYGHCFTGTMEYIVVGTGQLAGFNRFLSLEMFAEVHTGPRNPGDPVQTFPNDMLNLQGQLYGDPDFCTLIVTGGTGNGLPSPGSTTLTQLPSGDFNVDSFFDITYQIEFEGCPGSILEGFAGTTTATIRMQTGEPVLLPIPLIGGEDPYTSPCGTFEFGEDGDCEIPPEFFGPGSDPFDGIIAFKGNPSEGSMFPNADVLITRTMDINIEPGITETVPIEIVQLSLKSTDPIKVTYDGGMTESFFDVFVEIDIGSPSTGTSDITQIDDFGGEFDYDITLQPVFTFVELGPGPDRVFSPGGWGYSSAGPNLWTLSPIPGEFDVVSDERIILQSPSGTTIELLPLPIRYDNFSVQIDETGAVENSYGTGWNNSTWYYYPWYPWTNVWFYDHPYDPNRQKIITGTLELLPRDPGQNSTVEIVWNWTTPLWPGWPDNDQPPLPEDVDGDPYNEDDVIVRQPIPYFFNGIINGPIPIEVPFATLNYNPEWISVDIRGSNFILNGDFQHICWTEGNCSEQDFDFGDAPEDALAYPSLGIVGNFPTCVGVPVAGWIQHQTTDLYFLPWFDLENEGNAGLCPSFNPNQYNQDECFIDGDAGLIIPDAFTIVGPVGSETVQPCASANNQHLGFTCQQAIWGTDIDIDVHNNLANGSDAYLNMLVDWNQDGQWFGFSDCPGGPVQEHVLVDLPIPYGYSGPVSGLIGGLALPIGPNPGYIWVRFSLTEVMVDNGWNGEGLFDDGETEDYLLLVLEQEDQIDFGDANDPSYPTWLGSNGARHMIDGITYLGASVDHDPDGQPHPNALGDDNDGNDDEDGVIFDWPLELDNPCKITVNASVANGLFSGWVDFDGNGSWADPGEQVFADVPILNAGNNSLYFSVPGTSTAGLTTYARFRYSNQAGLSYDGAASDGEVEDYEVEITENDDYKWAQYPDVNLPGLHAHDYDLGNYQSIVLADDWLCNGGVVTDIHWWGNYEVDASNNELKGAGIDHFHISIHNHDYSGECLPQNSEILGFNVTFDPSLEQNTGLTNLEGSPIYLYEYILPEPFAQDEGARYWVDITAISVDPTNPPYWRWQESMRSYYPILCGAVEKTNPTPGTWATIQWPPDPYKYSDMAFIITSVEEELMDFGDADDGPYPTLLASDGARHLIDGVTYLGASVDSEPDGQPDPMALGDDNDGNDDEDGVTLNTAFPITPGGTPWFDIQASVDGILNVWIDWNGNGSWADVGDHAKTDYSLVSGLNTVQINVPANAVIGTTYARFRFSSVSGLSYTGNAPDGEVEDHEITIVGDVDVSLKAFLEGPFNGTTMNTDLNSNNLIPLNQPYNSDATAPWYYTGPEFVPAIPNPNIVDWVMVEFRDAPSPAAATAATMVSQQAAFILNDGSIVGLDGVSSVQTNGLFTHNLYVVIWHRNHLGIMSSGSIVPTGINQYSYDFSGGPGQAYLSGQINLGGGIYGLAGGDGKPDGNIDNQDIVTIWNIVAGTYGYLMVDYNLDTQVDNKDKNNVWYTNIGSGTQVPN